jgi:hypothetical protein
MSQPRPMQPRPIERLQSGWFGRQVFTTRDHGWPKGPAALVRCIHCDQTRTEASSPEHAMLIPHPADRVPARP